VIAGALAAGELSGSWARQVCAWTDRLPLAEQDTADEILVAAARGGVDLAGLAGLAQEMYERTHRDRDQENGLADRGVWLGTTIGGAGRVTGDLTPGCSAALTTVLEALGTRSGPDDIRSVAQRHHDALEQACRRLIASGMLPGHAGKPAAVQVHMTLSQLRDLPGAAEAEAAWAAARSAQPGWLTRPEAGAAACDGSVAPVVTGCVDWAALDRLTGFYLATHSPRAPHPADPAGGGEPAHTPPSPASVARLRQTMLRLAADVLSGPGGLASALRTTCLAGGPGAGPSAPLGIPLPLDTGDAAPAIPPALRRAVLARHVTCCFPGCAVPAAQCHIHHFTPRSQGGRTVLNNLGPVCEFHHLIVIHSWGWRLTLNGDGTTTATSRGGQRVLHSHSPPGQAA
jgi:hypothetical protein